jgi:hypothetical protein
MGEHGGDERLADVAELVPDQRLAVGAPGEQRLAELRIGLEHRHHQVQRPTGQGGVLLHRHKPGAADPDQPGGLRPLDDPGEVSEFLAGFGLEDPVADLRVDRVAGAEQFHQVAGVRQPDPAGLGELAPRTHPCHERADLPGQHRVFRGRLKIVHGDASRLAWA